MNKFRGKRKDGEGRAEGWYLEIGGKPYIRTFPNKKTGVSQDHFIHPDSVESLDPKIQMFDELMDGLKDARKGIVSSGCGDGFQVNLPAVARGIDRILTKAKQITEGDKG